MSPHLLVGWQVALRRTLELSILALGLSEFVHYGIIAYSGILGILLQLCHGGFQSTDLFRQVILVQLG